MTALLDPSVGGVVDLGDGRQGTVLGRDNVIPRLLFFFGGASGTTLVSQFFDGHPGVMAFRNRELMGIATLDVADGRIVDIHSVADPRRLQAVNRLVSHTGDADRP